MIESIYIKAFKSFIEEEIYLGNLTVLTGLNSSGKSSIIHALRMLNNVVLIVLTIHCLKRMQCTLL